MTYGTGLAVVPETRHEAIYTPFIDGALTYGDAFSRYATSSLGIHHANQALRYAANWGYERNQMLTDLGMDVHPIGHMLVAHGTLQGFLWHDTDKAGEDLSPAEIMAMRVAAQFHDVGENTSPELATVYGGVVGDVPYGDKNDAQRMLEARIATDVITKTLPELDEDQVEGVIELATHRTESAAHRILDRSHTWTFYADAYHAQQAINNTPPDQRDAERVRKLEGLVTQVLGNILPRLEIEATSSSLIERALDVHDTTFKSK